MWLKEKIDALQKYWKYGGKITQLTLSQVSYGGVLKDKRIVVTGGGSGIGLEMAKKFISEGADVIITGRNESKLDAVARGLNNPRLKTLEWDVTDIDTVPQKLSRCVELLGGVDCFVNNAAFVDRRSDTVLFWDNSMNTNAKSLYFISKGVVDLYLRHNNGHVGKILNISSLSSYINNANPYGISKTTVNRITKGFAKEYASKNIIVNAIAPGYVASSINYQDVEENAYSDKNPLHRIITPEDIAELACFLLSDASNAIVGQIITVDGGSLL